MQLVPGFINIRLTRVQKYPMGTAWLGAVAEGGAIAILPGVAVAGGASGGEGCWPPSAGLVEEQLCIMSNYS